MILYFRQVIKYFSNFRAKVQLLSNAPATPVLTMDKLDRVSQTESPVFVFAFLAHPALRPRLAYAIGLHLSTIHKKCFSSLNSYPISILFGLFERACACALNVLTDLRNFNYYSTYDLIRT